MHAGMRSCPLFETAIKVLNLLHYNALCEYTHEVYVIRESISNLQHAIQTGGQTFGSRTLSTPEEVQHCSAVSAMAGEPEQLLVA